MNVLKAYGFTDRYRTESKNDKDLKPARVIAQFKGSYKIMTEDGEKQGQLSGKLRHETSELAKFPAVGDFVMVSYLHKDDMAIIHHVLTRKSVFLRTAVGMKEQAQVVAANIDIIFICMSVNINYNLNRLERYLSIAWDSGAKPVIVLTKSDLNDHLSEMIEEVARVSMYSDVMATSMFEDNRLKFAPYLKEGVTSAFIGSSGVGKSTLINQILENRILETNEIGKGDKGRHTTTGRELFLTSLGGVVIDTPGMREIGIQNADLSQTFADMEELSKQCKFNDCSHSGEPGCAIQKALNEGLLDQRRFDSYIKLRNEASYEGLSSRQIESRKFERMFKAVGGMKNARKFTKEKNKNK